MAYLATEEDNKQQQDGMMGAPQGGAPIGGMSAPRQSRSGGWVNLQKYLGGGDQTTDKITGAIEQQKSALGQDVAGTEQKTQQLGSMLQNPNAFTAQQFQQASSFAPTQDFQKKTGELGQNIANLSTDTGRFNALRNAQAPTATGGQSRLNQFLMSHGTGGEKIGQYAQGNEQTAQQLAQRYGAATQGVQAGTQALRDALTGERSTYGALEKAAKDKTYGSALPIDEIRNRTQDAINKMKSLESTPERVAAIAQRQSELDAFNKYLGYDRSRMEALQRLMGA